VRPRVVWSAFAACLILAAAALVWSTRAVLRLERDERAARSQAAVEENARLALWRMDSWITPLLAQETARPYFHYRTFYPAAGAYSGMFDEPEAGTVLVPSPLRREPPPYVLLHFQLAPNGVWSSPQTVAPGGNARLLELQSASAITAALHRFAEAAPPAAAPPRPATPTPVRTKVAPSPVFEQKLKSSQEYAARQQNVELTNQIQQRALPPPPPAAVSKLAHTGDVESGAMTPVWVGDALLLVRRVRVNGALYIQGCQLDWPRLQETLLDSVRELLPQARLERADAATQGEDERRLAALPVRLVPGGVDLPPASFSPVRLSLLAAGGAVLLAALSMAALLRGVMDLSERRRVFVSAVTHELRTPLTTFRLYTDMLADGMVEGEEKRQSYLERLRSEAERLSHLVENVLFYARLESGRAGAVRETVDLFEVVRDTVARLEPRAAAAGLELRLDDKASPPLTARIDRSALEQILVNLVDNACKYAAASQPPVVHVRLERSGGRVLLSVRDFGPGLSKLDRRRLFRPFSKSDREAAASAPGVGLGLALSRRLARAQGGDLRLDSQTEGGAAFVLSLPGSPTD
jgi:signal transduction histidine kinase